MTTETAATDTGTTQDTGASTTTEATTAPAEGTVLTGTDAQTSQTAETPAESTSEATTKADDKPALKAPEKYEFKAQEGKELSPVVLAEFEKIARELDLSQEGAQKMLDSVAPQIEAAQQAAHQQMVNDWADKAKTDKEFGGDKLQENLAIAKKALEAFGTPELTEVLNKTGLGNHPEVIRAFYRAGQKISSAPFVPAGKPAGTEQSASNKLYPSK
ncbi:protease [Aquitalea palustris]|uniref:Protease n=1 Tax=Aquitalea palustris TaxID=2480983 RepID=A0A454JKY9_9NEIS|nr:protease [Aquitalea palustris]RMD00061.1 protease [Aquitalea palustris]